MTYSGTPSNVSTLAHELGHAFHSYAMRDIHPLNRSYAMNVAETASTFAEMVVSDAAVKEATNEEEKLILLEDKIQRSVSLLMILMLVSYLRQDFTMRENRDMSVPNA